MKLTKKQKQEILPHLQTMVQAMIDLWEAQRLVEQVLDANFSAMNVGAEYLSVGYDTGDQVSIDDVQGYIDQCEGD